MLNDLVKHLIGDVDKEESTYSHYVRINNIKSYSLIEPAIVYKLVYQTEKNKRSRFDNDKLHERYYSRTTFFSNKYDFLKKPNCLLIALFIT
ncbi:hypothetical protein [Candidatus Phytoplasma melaleucae]|uniref:Uncharacterized protein n=1 Tax=Candidatus Phytoplasma melaleucae TaxID=2982630 RepID=A0ABT9DD04_9MOLU|nr:hypothetical protein ['Melaleuca sp.' phytoplasma]MDO8167975.1 hypothetical protein ['Melaleuca sp.' phytoplasma]